MAKAGCHSRSVSNATSNYTSDFNEQPSKFRINYKVLFVVFGLLFSIAACGLYVYFPLILRRVIQSYINIKPNQEFYDFWLQSSEPTEVGIYFFHVENPWAVENGLEKLRVREMGKYMFK